MGTTDGILAGKRGLVMGVANDHSIAWGIAKKAADEGAELAFTYQGEAFGKRVKPLAESVGSTMCFSCNAADDAQIAETCAKIKEHWDSIDFVVHAVAYSDKEELKGRYVDTTRTNFAHTMDISCFSFTAVAKQVEPLLNEGGSLITLTYSGSQRVMPSYNVMGVAKAALEASVRYLANDLGTKGVRVNALSAGPMRTLAGSAISGARFTYNWQGRSSPLGRNITMDEVAGAACYLLSDLSAGVTGEVHNVDSGYNVIGMAVPRDD